MSAQEITTAVLVAAMLLAWAGIVVNGVRHLPRFCKHDRWTRYWFKQHRYAVVCKRCKTTLATGRDVSHRYPDDEIGVRRGRHAAAR